MRRTVTLLLLTILTVGRPALSQEFRPPIEFRPLATWGHDRLRETSGIAVSRQHPGVLWTHNDSGDGPYLYAVDTTGALLAVFEVRGARAVDWEDLALGPCAPARWQGRTCLYIADTGDNDERRTRAVLYAVPEPEVIPPDARGPIRTARARALRIRYPDRPHDAEALAAFPNGTLALVTKGRSGAILRFGIPAEAWQDENVALGRPDTLPIEPQILVGRWVTGAAAAPDGAHVVVRTYTEVYRFGVDDRWTAAGPPCRMGLMEAQGEAVDFLEGDRLILGSERARRIPGGISVLRCDWN